MSIPALTIRGVTTRAVALPLPRPLATRVLTIDQASLLLVDLHTEEGVDGRTYLFAFTRPGARHLASVLEDAVEMVRGMPVAPADIFARVCRGLTLMGNQGLTLMAASALDMAGWDALAKAMAVPLVTMLGGSPGRRVEAYNSNGLGLSPPEQLAEEARALVEDGGFRAVKVRLGRERMSDDIAAVRAVRAAVGDDVVLPTDFNQGLTVVEAVQRGRALDQEGIYWIEEPIAYDDLSGNAKVAREVATPIQIGENLYGPRMVADAVAAGAADYLMFDLMRIGGITGWIRAAGIADAAGIEVSSHLFPEFSRHLAPVTPTWHWLEYMSWADPILAEPIEVVDGYVRIPDTPGAGIDWDEGAVKRYLI